MAVPDNGSALRADGLDFDDGGFAMDGVGVVPTARDADMDANVDAIVPHAGLDGPEGPDMDEAAMAARQAPGLDEGPRMFFRITHAMPSKQKVLPMMPGACRFMDSSDMVIHMKPVVEVRGNICASLRPRARSRSEAVVLRDLVCDWSTLTSGMLKWTASSDALQYFWPGRQGEELQPILTEMLRCGAFPQHAKGSTDVTVASDDKYATLQGLAADGLVHQDDFYANINPWAMGHGPCAMRHTIALDCILARFAGSSRSVYQSHWSWWAVFCKRRRISPLRRTTPDSFELEE